MAGPAVTDGADPNWKRDNRELGSTPILSLNSGSPIAHQSQRLPLVAGLAPDVFGDGAYLVNNKN